MAGGEERVLRRRIKSVQSTKKITKAMELIAASQILRSQSRIAVNRPYRAGMARIVLETAKGDRAASAKLLGTPENRQNVAILALVADRGLAGPYNSSVLRTTERLIKSLKDQGITPHLYTVGKKAQGYFRFRGQEVVQDFIGISDRPTFEGAREVAAVLAAPFAAGEVDEVILVSTRYRTSSSQGVETHQLLPLPNTEELNDEANGDPQAGVAHVGYTEFEPDVATLLESIAPKAMESEIFTALLEGAASFFTAQQRAMAAASENADELVRTLSRKMNRARQDAITTEIMEIVSGAEALRQTKGA